MMPDIPWDKFDLSIKVPEFRTQQDVDEAYCRGYNNALDIDAKREQIEGARAIDYLCWPCKFCDNWSPVAEYCCWCGKEKGWEDDDTRKD